MTVAKETTRSGPYSGDDQATRFPYGFRVDDKRHLRVVKVLADGAESALELDADYSVTGVGNREGGAVVLTQPLVSGTKLVIVRDQPLTQEMDLVNQGPFFAEDVEAAFDRAVMRDQELAERLSRAVTVPLGDSGDPKDYLAQMQALMNQALAAIQGQSEVSVLAHGALGDRETNDLAAFQAARDRAVALGLDRVVIPAPPNPADWYFLLGDIEGVTDVEWIVEAGAAINGSTNLFAVQQKWSGATVWEGPLDEVEVLPVGDGDHYAHQIQIGVDLDNEWIMTYQTNDTSPREGSDQQFPALHKSLDGGEGLVWSERVAFATDPAACNNPLPMGPAPGGGKWTAWQTGVINYQQEGFGSKLWVRFGGGRFSGIGGVNFCQKTTAEGLFTLYRFYMLSDGTIKPVRYGDDPPAGASFNAWTHEGERSLFPYCHDTYFSSSGRLHFLMVLQKNSGLGIAGAKRVCVMYCDNPGADLDDMVFTLGPRADIGNMDLADTWEYSMAEEAEGHFVVMMRRRERFGSRGSQEGQWHFIAFGDGITFSGWKPAGLHAYQDRPSLIRLNNEHLVYMTHDEPTTRANPAIWLKARGGGFAPGLSIGNFDNLEVKRATTRKVSKDDTVIQAIDSTTDTVLGFTGAKVRVEHVSSAGERVDMALEGWIPDWGQSTLDLSEVEIAPDDKAVIEVSGIEETFFVDGGAQTSFAAEADLTAGTPDVFAYNGGMESTLTIGSGGVLISTAGDGVEVQASATDIDFIVLHQTGNKGTITLSTGQSVIDVSASLGFALAEDWTDVSLIENDTGDTLDVPELDGLLSTANSNLTVLKDSSASDQFRWAMRRGDQLHVPVHNRHPVTGDLLVGSARQPMTAPETGGKGLHASILRAENFPRTDKLVIIPRRSAEIEDANPGHVWNWNAGTGILELVGKTSAGASLKPGRWQISGRLLLSQIPSSSDSALLFQVGNFEEIVSVEAVWRRPHLVRDLYRRIRSGGARDTAKERPIKRKPFAEVTLSGDDYVLADDIWVGFTFFYDSYRGEITIEGETLSLQWPFVLTLGDGYLLSDAPTDRSLFWDVNAFTVQELPEDHRQWSSAQAPADAPNLIINPGFEVEAETEGGSFPIQQPRALLPGWSVRARGGCKVNPRRGSNSQTAANREHGGWPHYFSVEVEDAVRLPLTAATGEVVVDLAWPGIGSVPSGNYMLQVDLTDGLELGAENSARPEGLPVFLYWFQDYGERAQRGRLYYPIYPLRVQRWQRSFAVPIPVPAVALPSAGVVVEPDSSCGFELRIEAGYNCQLAIRNLDFFKGTEPRPWTPPSRYRQDETKRIFHAVKAPKIGAAVAQGVAVNASQGDFLIELPDMERPPYLGSDGAWAMDDLSAQHTGQFSLVEANEQVARVRLQKTGAAMATGSPLLLRGLSPQVFEKAGNDAGRIFTASDMVLDHEEDVGAIYKRDSAGSTIDLTFGESVVLKPSYDTLRDKVPSVTGQSSFTPEVSLPPSMTAVDVVEFSQAGGEELLPLGDGGWTMGSTAVDGVGAVTLLGSSGTAKAMVSGHDYEVHLRAKATAPHLILEETLPGSASLVVEHAEESASRLLFDARYGRPFWLYHAQTDALWNAISAAPDPKDGRFLKRDLEMTIRDLIEAGIWAKLDLLKCFAAHDEATALINWINPGTDDGTATNSPTFTPYRGYAFDGVTSYVFITGYDISTDAANYAQDSASTGAYIYAASSDGGMIGATVTHRLRIAPVNGSAMQAQMNANSAFDDVPFIRNDGVRSGYYAVDRSSAANYQVYGQGASGRLRRMTVTEASTGVPTTGMSYGRSGSSFSNAEMAWGYIGASLSAAQHRRLAAIMEDHLIRIGAL